MQRSKFSLVMSELWSRLPLKLVPPALRTNASLKGEEALLRVKLTRIKKEYLAELVEARKRINAQLRAIAETGVAKPADISKLAEEETQRLKKLVAALNKASKKEERLKRISTERKARKPK